MASPASTSADSRFFNRHWTWWSTVLVLVLVAIARISLMNFPLERDEGEYAYAGQLLLQGVPPYQLAYNMKFPGTYAGYAVIMALFGETPAGIHLGILCITTFTALMLYWLGKKILDPCGGMVAATTHAVLATESGMFGMAGHATHFTALFVTAGWCAMWKARQETKWTWAVASAVLFGAAVLTKQHAVFICAWAAIVFALDSWSHREIPLGRRCLRLAAIAAGFLLPFGVCCLWLWHEGVFPKFWFWTIDYARQYVAIRSLADIWIAARFSIGEILMEYSLLWAVVCAGAVLVWLDDSLKPIRLWLAGFAFASLLTTVPGFYFRTHYFLLTLPAAGLLAACTVQAIRRQWNRRCRERFRDWPIGAFYLLLLAVALYQKTGEWRVLAKAQGPDAPLSHALYGNEPFAEAEAVSRFIRANSQPDARIAVLGSEPEIYFLSRRHSATGYIYMYPLMEPQPFARQMQDEMIREIETNRPEYVVVAIMDSSWLASPASDRKIFDWWQNYQANYALAGIADMISPARIYYVFGTNAVAQYGKTATNGLAVFQRKTAPVNPP
jgi:Dolichyl-phosphate-mannose-protein mannosyltransferase